MVHKQPLAETDQNPLERMIPYLQPLVVHVYN